jgi:hypothetical protein
MKHLDQLSEDLEIQPPPVKDDTGLFHFPLNESLSIAVKELDPGVLLTSPIAPCPNKKRELLFIKLMKANLFGQGTLGSTIGLSLDEKLLTLSSAIPYEMDYRGFKEAFEDFANVVDYWRTEVTLHIEEAEGGIL